MKKASGLSSVVLGFVLLIQPAVSKSQIFSDESLKFGQVLDWIDKYYVDSVDKSKLVENAIIGMLKTLDPHSTYLTKEEFKAMSEPLQGNFEGIGVSFNILQDTIFVINPVPNGPSDKVGIQAGDRIVMIEGQNVAGIGIKTNDVYTKLRGRKGTSVAISVSRRSENELLDFNIVRDKIPINSLDASYMISQDIGYIKLNRFSFTTMDEFGRALDTLKNEGMKDLVLDLSGNGGGYLDVAVRLVDQFLDERKLIVYYEGHSQRRHRFYSTLDGDFKKGRVVIIIDQGSASASEIVAGAIQDWDRGVIVGRRSFGKGLVQNPLLLQDSSMVRLTIARYYTPTGRLIQKPYDNGYEEYSRDLVNRFNSGELSHEDMSVFPDSLKYLTLISQRPVYGGGGIMPDFFVPIDTSYITSYYNRLINKGILNIFILNYLDNNRDELYSSYPTFEVYMDKFRVRNALLDDLIDSAAAAGLPFQEKDFEMSREYISLLLKAYLARDLWSTSEFYQIINTSVPSVLKATEVLENQRLYQALLQEK